MFDKLLFDRNAFDRSVSSEGLALTILGSGQIETRITIKTPIGVNFNSTSAFIPAIQMQQKITNPFGGTGDIGEVLMILRRSTTVSLNGQGSLDTNLTVRTPIMASLSGQGDVAISSRMLMTQQVLGALSGASEFIPRPVMSTAINGALEGGGEMLPQVILQLPLVLDSKGQGAFILRRLGALNENVIELIGIDFLPGETITIDTDLLQVLFGATEDVSSITSDSVFFELNPGENEIVFDVDANSSMDIVAIWQNRWL